MTPTDLKKLFTAWGLKKNEAQVLQFCMRQGRGLYVHEIVSATKIKRSTVDLILSRLVDRGFVARMRTGRRYQYFPEKPDAILQKQKQQVGLFEAVLPMLEKWQQEVAAPDVRIYQGIEGISEHYRDILSVLAPLPTDQRVLFSIESGGDVMKIRPDLDRFFIQKRVKNGIQINIICPESAAAEEVYRTNPQKLRDCRYFADHKKLFAMALYLYHDRVALISLKTPLQVVVIRHPVVSQSMQAIFNVMWGSLAI